MDAAAPPLTNLGHLDWMQIAVRPPHEPGHTTYRLAEEPEIGALWTYAEVQPDGSYLAVGGGPHDAETGHWGQGAFNADDIARAAVVYLRHWQATGAETSRRSAYQLLRGLAFFQTTEGPDAGNVVLWMQTDGSLIRSADPPERPDPSDSDASFWLARTLWATGEGYAAFRDVDPDFAAFLRERLRLAVTAVRRNTLVRYGEWREIDGTRVPRWLITGGADATAEAMLGLAPYVAATGDEEIGVVLDQFAEGVAAMGAGNERSWPFGAVLPRTDRHVWHAWAGLAPAGLARAYAVRGGDRVRDAAVADAASFTPHLLIAAGPDSGWTPAPTDLVQIAYGAQSRVESLLAVAEATDRPALASLAAVAASWFFGNNPAGKPMYDRATGRTYDGIDADSIHPNSGAESTIHGLLAMLALDANPALADLAQTASIRDRRTWTFVPRAARLSPGERLQLTVPAGQSSLLMPVIEQGPTVATTRWHAGPELVGDLRHAESSPGALAMATLARPVQVDEVTVTSDGGEALIRGVLVQPELEWLALERPGTGHGTVLLRSFATDERYQAVHVPGTGPATVTTCDHNGRTRAEQTAEGSVLTVAIAPGGFTLIVR